MKSIKHDQDKADLSYITPELEALLARVRMYGSQKYSRNNWLISGFTYTRSTAALKRHLALFMAGEDLDDESGLPHIGHILCCVEHLLHDYLYHPENDDRYKLSPERLAKLKELLNGQKRSDD